MEYYTSRTVLPEKIEIDKSVDPTYIFENKTCEQTFGVNCFDEVLSEWDLRIHMGIKYTEVVKSKVSEGAKDLKFYSKRLNIAIFGDSKEPSRKEVNHNLTIIDLRGK